MKKFGFFNMVSLTLGLLFLYVPIIILIVFSFNESKLVTVWSGFSTKWYVSLFDNAGIKNAVWVTLKVAFMSATIATILGTIAGLVIAKFGQFKGRGLFSVMLCSMASALSGVGRGIKWLSNINMVLSFGLLAFFLLFGSTLFGLELLAKGTFSYVMALPAMTFTVWDPNSALGGWQTGWTVFYWAWWIAFAPFVGIFLARISKNRSIREFVAGAIIAPSIMCFIWFTWVGGTAIDLELSGAANGAIFDASLTARLYEVMNVMLSAGMAQFMSVMIVILLLTYLVTSADSAILVVNTINSGGESERNNGHIILWSALLGAVIAALLLAGGLGAIQSAMIIGAVPFSFMMVLMGIALLKALWRDSLREKQGSTATESS